MEAEKYDLVIIGAGSGGLTGAGFAAQLGANVALVEKNRIGGDCTWTGCVPSKALIRAAKIAHAVRTASHYGVSAGAPVADMAKVREFVQSAISKVYAFETPEELRKQGVDVVLGPARFLDSESVAAGDRLLRARTFLIATGAGSTVPALEGLDRVDYSTYEQIFENERLPRRMLVLGGGPIGMELAQAYQRLGSAVTVIARRLLPRDEPEAGKRLERIFIGEGVRFVYGLARSARQQGAEIVITTDEEEARGDLLLVATGRRPNVARLDLDKAGVHYSEKGVPVDSQLRTNVKHIYAAGDVLGGYQFTHLAGWQAFQAVRNALLPGSASGIPDVLPWVTFTDPEVARAGVTEAEARARFGDRVVVSQWEMAHTDRAICENDTDGFIKVIAREDGTIVGATVMAARAGETIAEFALAIGQKLKTRDVGGTIHPYPTYSTAVQQVAGTMAVQTLLSGVSWQLVRGLSKLMR